MTTNAMTIVALMTAAALLTGGCASEEINRNLYEGLRNAKCRDQTEAGSAPGCNEPGYSDYRQARERNRSQ